MTSAAEQFSRLHELVRVLGGVKQWLAGRHVEPLAETDRKRITHLLSDVERPLQQWKAEPELLVVVLLGGTGVGKSTLLNALAGSAVASAGLMRPTTETPTLYHHRDTNIEKLDGKLRDCKTVAHDRPTLRHKILVDTPDIDGSVVEHHDRLRSVLPLADAVLYVGSQEKYHDREGWRLLLENRRSRAFAFVLNKWDRCQAAVGDRGGESPDKDFRRSLAEAGFENPLLFRISASQWAMRRLHKVEPDEAVADDFLQLEDWLENGLHEQSIRSIKLSGFAGKLGRLTDELQRFAPQDFSRKSAELHRVWEAVLAEAAREQTHALVETADRNAPSFDGHFRSLDRREYTGVFGWYLTIAHLLSRVQLTLRPSLSTAPIDGLTQPQSGALVDWVKRTLAETPEIVRDNQRDDVRRRLLTAANRMGWPTAALDAFLPPSIGRNADAELYQSLLDEATGLERELRTPGSPQFALRRAFRFSANWLPWGMFVGVIGHWIFSVLFRGAAIVTLTPIVLALTLMLLTMMSLHFILHRFLPTEWRQLRGRFSRGLELRLSSRLAPDYLKAIDAFVAAADQERRMLLDPLEELRRATKDVQQNSPAIGDKNLFAVHNPATAVTNRASESGEEFPKPSP